MFRASYPQTAPVHEAYLPIQYRIGAAEVLLSGLFASVVAVGVTVAIERLGDTAGGVLGTVPTTIVPVTVGLAYRVDTAHMQAALFMLSRHRTTMCMQ